MKNWKRNIETRAVRTAIAEEYTEYLFRDPYENCTCEFCCPTLEPFEQVDACEITRQLYALKNILIAVRGEMVHIIADGIEIVWSFENETLRDIHTFGTWTIDGESRTYSHFEIHTYPPWRRR